jgi:predicted acyltransferase
LLSLDVLRGLDVLLMLFVNEMAGVAGTPAFLQHVAPGVDGMTITDVVFPAFLFITGMAIPLALGARLRRGDARGAVWRHVWTRSLALVVIGVFMVNAEHGYAPPPFPVHLWNVLMTCAVLLVWQAPASGGDRRGVHARLLFGTLLLGVAAVTYRSAEGGGLLQLRPQWWGILGLIGWAYLVAASLYLLAGDRALVLAAASAALYGVYFADEFAGVSWLAAARPYLSIGSVLGSHGALVTSGSALTVILLARRDAAGGGRVTAALVYAAGLLAAGLVLHQFRSLGPAFWINKPLATPAWCLLSASITAVTWTALHYIVDVRHVRRWPATVVIAGENALLAYLLAPLLLSLLALSGGADLYGTLGRITIVGWARSMAFAWVVVRLCGWLRDRGFRVRL